MSVRGFMDEFRAGTTRYSGPHIWNERVSIIIAPHRTWVTLCRIQALDAGHGDGSAAMKWLCALADKHRVRMSGVAEPFGSRFLELPALIVWYNKFGFTVTNDYYIDREVA